LKEKFKTTHRLKKSFVYNEEEIYRKGSPVFIPKGNQGFRCNVFFLTPTGRIRSNRDHVVLLYSKTFFKPIKNWFEVV